MLMPKFDDVAMAAVTSRAVMRTIGALFTPLVVLGCASTSVEFAGERPARMICQDAGERVSALVSWGPAWRADQKDAASRAQAAEQGIRRYFATSGCFDSTQIRRLPVGTAGSPEEARAAAGSGGDAAQRVVYIAVKELGPVVKLLSSAALLEGGTEVVLDIATYDLANGRHGRFTTHWRNGGAGVVKGVASLPDDMQAALAAALGRAADPQ